MALRVISRKEAAAIGLRRYFTAEPCSRGHVAERAVSNKSCIECSKLTGANRVKKWRDENRERARKHSRDQYAKRTPYAPESVLVSHRKASKKWREANPQKAIVANTNRRARKRDAAGSYSAGDIDDLFKKQKMKCANCGRSIKRKYDIDHIHPLARGGTNYISNIQLLCPRCNGRKHSKDPFVWAQQNGRLL